MKQGLWNKAYETRLLNKTMKQGLWNKTIKQDYETRLMPFAGDYWFTDHKTD